MKRRRFPPMRLTVPVYRGPVKKNDFADLENARRRDIEITAARGTRKSQRLSNLLAWTYHRDVFADAGLPQGSWATEGRNNIVLVRYGLPDSKFLFEGVYRAVSVSWDTAERLLARDRREDTA